MEEPRAWLARPCPTCKVEPHHACRDEDGYFTNTHEARMEEA